MTTTIKKSIAKASFKFVPPSRLGNWDKLGQAYLDKIDRAIANSRLLARYRLSTYFEKATEEVGKGLNSKREHVRLDTAHKILKGGGIYEEREETISKQAILGDIHIQVEYVNRNTDTNNLTEATPSPI